MLTNRAVAARDCLDCGAPQGMTLENVIATAPLLRNPLLYCCKHCRAQLTIPPPPLSFDARVTTPGHRLPMEYSNGR